MWAFVTSFTKLWNVQDQNIFFKMIAAYVNVTVSITWLLSLHSSRLTLITVSNSVDEIFMLLFLHTNCLFVCLLGDINCRNIINKNMLHSVIKGFTYICGCYFCVSQAYIYTSAFRCFRLRLVVCVFQCKFY